MRLRVDDPALTFELIEFFELRADVVTERLSNNEIEVSLLGSYGREGQRMALDLLVRAWWAGRAAGPIPIELID